MALLAVVVVAHAVILTRPFPKPKPTRLWKANHRLSRRNTLPILHELQAKMKGRGIDTTLGLLGLKFEPQDVASTALGLATAASVVALPAAPASFLLLPLAVALTVLPYLRKRRDEKRESLGASPAAYLLQLYDYSWR